MQKIHKGVKHDIWYEVAYKCIIISQVYHNHNVIWREIIFEIYLKPNDCSKGKEVMCS